MEKKIANDVINSGLISKVQIKITMSYHHLTLVRMAIIKKSTNNNAREGVERKNSSYSADGIINWCSSCEE